MTMNSSNNEYSSFNFKDLSVENLKYIAQIDNEIPLQYNPQSVSPKEVEAGLTERIKLYQELKSPNFAKAILANDKVIAFHVLECFQKNPLAAKIITLWVHPNYRKMGLAKKLKTEGVNWAKENKMNFIQTGVHKANSHMLDINKKKRI
jgi:ribosomal protein S18 acetylase RimI-like enzyme